MLGEAEVTVEGVLTAFISSHIVCIYDVIISLPNSVTWIIDDLVVEYSMQITQQMNKLTSIVKQHHWRVNPNVLAGMRVAAFRKGSNPMPIVITG